MAGHGASPVPGAARDFSRAAAEYSAPPRTRSGKPVKNLRFLTRADADALADALHTSRA